MKVMYISNLCEKSKFFEIYIKQFKPGQQVQKFNRLIFDGFKLNNIDAFCYSSLPMSKKVYDGLFLHIDNNEKYKYVNIINIPIIKDIYILIASFLVTLYYLLKDKELQLFVDPMAGTISLSSTLASRLLNRSITVVITDLPEYVSQDKIFNFVADSCISLASKYVFLTGAMNEKINKNNKPHIIMEGLSDFYQIKSKNNFIQYVNKTVFYAGSLNKDNGIDNLCNAIINLKGRVDLIIYGEGDYREEIEVISNSYNFIKYKGVANNDQIILEEQKCWLLINPRPCDKDFVKYSFPSKTMEYMASGRPLLTTKLPGIPQEYDEYVYYIKDDIASEIINILEIKDDDLNKKAEAAKLFVLYNKNNKAQVKRIIKLMEEK